MFSSPLFVDQAAFLNFLYSGEAFETILQPQRAAADMLLQLRYKINCWHSCKITIVDYFFGGGGGGLPFSIKVYFTLDSHTAVHTKWVKSEGRLFRGDRDRVAEYTSTSGANIAHGFAGHFKIKITKLNMAGSSATYAQL